MLDNTVIANLPRADQSVADVMAAWPGTIRVFLDRRMACVGCPMAGFDTLAEAAANYRQPLDAFLAELCHAASAPEAR